MTEELNIFIAITSSWVNWSYTSNVSSEIIIIIIIIAAKSVNFISLHVFNICKFLTSGIVVVPQILIGYLS